VIARIFQDGSWGIADLVLGPFEETNHVRGIYSYHIELVRSVRQLQQLDTQKTKLPGEAMRLWNQSCIVSIDMVQVLRCICQTVIHSSPPLYIYAQASP
jgi:hypothetical protein